MRNIRVGYFDLQEKNFISGIVINDIFLRPLARYVKLIAIPVNKKKDIKGTFSRLKGYKLDYIYVDGYNFLLESFLLREKFESDTPFIVTLHTVFAWKENYTYLAPLIRKYDIIYAVSNYARKSFFRISDKFNVRVIPYCLDVDFIRSNISPNFKKDKKLITFMGRLVEEKGIGTLIRCMPEIIARAGAVHLNIIGPLSGEGMKDKPKSMYVKRIERIVRQLKLQSRVHFKGVQLGLDKYRLLSESDIFVSPTTALEEAFPMVNIEALACALPVVTTNWAGNKELVRDGKNGFLIDVNYGRDKKPKVDTRQLISVIVKTLKNKQLEAKMRKSALSNARRYDYRRVLPRLVSLLKKKVEAKVKSNWNPIKDKTVLDFRGIFNKDFFFFLNFDTHFRKKTYAALYKDVLSTFSSKKKRPSRAAKRMLRHRSRDLAIVKKLRQNLEHFLLLRSN